MLGKTFKAKRYGRRAFACCDLTQSLKESTNQSHHSVVVGAACETLMMSETMWCSLLSSPNGNAW